jgi:hypothetical protein
MERHPLLGLALFLSASRIYGSHLPFHIEGGHAKSIEPQWTFRIGERVYHQPPSSSSLSRHVSDYYFTIGSADALPEDLRSRRVATHGRVHILHLPEGTDGLEMTERRGNRRSSFTALTQMSSGQVLHFPFPKYTLNADYAHPSPIALQELENSTVASLDDGSPSLPMKFLKELVESFPTRSYSNPKASKEVQDHLQKKFKEMGLETCVQNFHFRGENLVNVVGIIPGKSASSITVGAHYDSRPFTADAPGAEDNGSGVAALLAIAKKFTEAKVTPIKTVLFAAFAGEEAGLLGSDEFAQRLQKGGALLQGKGGECSHIAGSFLQNRGHSNAKHKAIIMDEIGWKSPKCPKRSINLETYDWASPLMDHLAQSSMAHNQDELEIVHSNNPFGSDHMSFLERDMQGVLTINCDDEGYPHYHQSTDTISNIDEELMLRTAKMNLGALFRTAMEM